MSQQIQITGGAKVRNLEGVLTGTSGVVNSLGINVPSGIPQLDGSGKILVSQLPNSVMEYKGSWNAATNTPTLADGTGNAGDVYLCNVAGTVNFGSGPIVFNVGDQVIYSGTIWQRASGATGTVTSVAVTESGDALSITGSPITTSGTINIGFAGTGAQYIKGDGTLATFPTTIDQSKKLITEVYNSTGATLSKGTIVYINGGQGNLPTVTKALATGDATSAQTYGIVQSDITNMNNGFVVVIGALNDIDTQAYTAGTQLYLSPTTAGTWTSTKPYAPDHLVYVGIVVRSHPTQGVVEVRIQNGFELDELHNVAAQAPANGDIIQYVSSTNLWTKTAGTTTNIAEGTRLYYTDTRARAALSFAAGSGAYNSTTGVITIPTNTNQLTNGASFITLGSLSGGTGISYNNTTGVITSTITQYTDALARAAISLTTTGTSGAATYNSTTGAFNIPQYQSALTFGNLTSSNTAFLTVTGGTGAVIGTGTSILVVPSGIVENGLTLTTTGSSGAATFVGSTLNIPNYGSALSGYLPLTGGALTGPLTSSSNAVFKYVGGYALKLDSASATEENDLRFAKNGLDYGAIQTNTTTGDFEFYVDTTQAGGWVKMINILKNGTGTTFTGNISAGNLSGTNTGDQTLAGLGGVPTSRTLTINGTGYDLSADRSWTITAGVTGSGTQNKLTKWNNAGGTTIGDSIISADANTATITSTVVGAMFILDNPTASGYSQMQFKGDTKSAYIFKGNSNYTDWGGVNALNFYTDSVSGGGFSFNPRASANAVFIDPLGNLGIGVGTTVADKLDLLGGNANFSNTVNGRAGIRTINPSTGSSAYVGLTIGNDSAINAGGILMLGANWTTGTIYTANGLYVYTNRAGGVTISAEAGTIKFATNDSIKGTMLANGNLGLNTTDPTNLLHLAGNVATPSLRLASTSAGFYWDIGRENATTGDFVFNYKTPSTSSTEWVRITTLGLFGIGVTPSGTYGKLTVAGGIRTTADSLSKLEIGRYNAGNPDSYIKLGSTSNGLIVSNAADSADLFYFKNSGRFGMNRSPNTVLDVYGSNSGGALTFMQNTDSSGYTGIDFYRQSGTHAGSVWCANDTAGATNNRNALTLAARQTGEKVIIVGGGYDPTITGGLTVQGSEAKLLGTNAHLVIEGSPDYAYIQLKGTATSTRNAYFIQNNTGTTTNGVSAGAAYMYFDVGQQMEFVWAGTSRIQMTSAGAITAQGGFFDTSDSRLKIIVKDYEQPKGIQNVAARMYVKNNRKELGYYAQDLQEILPSAVVEGADGFLNLSYSQVHTAKIAYLEDKVAQLEKLIKSLL